MMLTIMSTTLVPRYWRCQTAGCGHGGGRDDPKAVERHVMGAGHVAIAEDATGTWNIVLRGTWRNEDGSKTWVLVVDDIRPVG